MSESRLPSPLIDVYRHSDFGPLRVQTEQPDLVLYDRTRIRHKWPATTDDPWHWQSFIAWAAAKRLGVVDQTFEAWESDVRAVDLVQDDDDKAASNGRPTLPAPEAD